MQRNNDDSKAADWILDQLYNAVAEKESMLEEEIAERAVDKVIEEHDSIQKTAEKLKQVLRDLDKLTMEEYNRLHNETNEEERKLEEEDCCPYEGRQGCNRYPNGCSGCPASHCD